jgi:hypothetical protein
MQQKFKGELVVLCVTIYRSQDNLISKRYNRAFSVLLVQNQIFVQLFLSFHLVLLGNLFKN